MQQAVTLGWTVLGACSENSNKSLPVVMCGDARLEHPTILVLGR